MSNFQILIAVWLALPFFIFPLWLFSIYKLRPLKKKLNTHSSLANERRALILQNNQLKEKLQSFSPLLKFEELAKNLTQKNEELERSLKDYSETISTLTNEKQTLISESNQLKEEVQSFSPLLKFEELAKNLTQKNEKLEVELQEYRPIQDIKIEALNASRIKDQLEQANNELKEQYTKKREVLKSLETQIAVYDEKLAFAELGVYEPHFDFDDSEVYKANIKAVRDRQKNLVSSKVATYCPTDWTVDGSLSKGKAMMNRQTRLTLRAFNNECEAAVANTRWNNAVAMERRILNSAKQINASNESMNLRISDAYVALKLEELHLTHEYRERKKIEKEEKAEIARAEREEKKLEAEAKKAEAEERKFQDLLDKARREAGVDEAKIAELEAKLAAAHELTERAKAMAEVTKSGYVYIISNIGSFGEDVVKIGLTRRLDPTDRVKELGDASVPFGFDTHAIIYSEKAPELEAKLHKEFTDRRVNSANFRKEFFRVGIDEVEQAVKRIAPEASFFKDREAQEWHETVALRQQVLTDMQRPSDEFPETI